MFSLLCRGYGTYDGIAKSEPNPDKPEHKEYFSLEDVHLPPIESPLRKAANRDFARSFQDDEGPRYENKPFKLPTLSTKTPAVPLSKTYSTKRGALVLYSETNALPGSPKARKRRRKYKKAQPVKLKTIGDLRDLVLSYKNGGDPLFLALLQKRLSATNKERVVRPGFSPKRYIATLGRNALPQDRWDKLATSGSLRDPALQRYNPSLPAVHADGSDCELFPGKPQPYSTMSLPPVSPSSSMFEGSFNFYKNALSTGAASMITVDSDDECAPSSRAVSPAESLEGRLDEVEPLPPRRGLRDPYAMLNEKQKADLLSRLLMQGTLESMDSDLEGWVADLSELSKRDQDPLTQQGVTAGVPGGRPRPRPKGSVRSGSLTSVPRLPPIYSAGARPSSPVTSDLGDAGAVRIPSVGDPETEDGEGGALDPSDVALDFSEKDPQSSLVERSQEGASDLSGTELTRETSPSQATEQPDQTMLDLAANSDGLQGDSKTSAVSMVTPASDEAPAPAVPTRSESGKTTASELTAADSTVPSVAKDTRTDNSFVAPVTTTTPPPLPPDTVATASVTTDVSGDGSAPDVTLDTDPAASDQASDDVGAAADAETQEKEVPSVNSQQNNLEDAVDDTVVSHGDVIIDAVSLGGEVVDQPVEPADRSDDGIAGKSPNQDGGETGAPQPPREAEPAQGAEMGAGKDADPNVAAQRGEDDDDAEDEGIGLEGEETDEDREGVSGERAEEAVPAATESQRRDSEGSRNGAPPNEDVNSREEPTTEQATTGDPEPNATPDEGDATEGKTAEPPPAISLDELHGQAQAVARKVLARPQSGMVFMEDVRNAVAMWADRLSNLLGPPPQLQETRISSAGPQRTPSAGKRRDNGALQTGAPVRTRKVSRSAGPSMAFLRNALLISRGAVPDLETLRQLPPLRLPAKFEKPSRSRRASGVVPPGHLYREPNDTDSTSSGPTQSIPVDRVSNSDLQMDIFSFVASEEMAMIERLHADEVIEDEVAERGEFQAAWRAIVSEAPQQSVVPVKSATDPASPPVKLKRKPSEKEVKKRATPPFTVPRPAESKPPPGLNSKETPAGEKSSQPSRKKAAAGRKKGAKPGAKQSKAKQPDKLPVKSKAKKGKAAAVKAVEAKGEEFEVVQEQKPEAVARVDSETGETDPGVSIEASISAVVSTVPSTKQSPEPSLASQKPSTSPTESISTHASEVPRLAPTSPEPEVISETEVSEEVEPSKEASEAAAKQLERQERAARRAAERAAAAERRRQEVERKRREREEAKRRAAEEEERLERLRQEQEEEMRKRGEERRRNREEKEAARLRHEEEEAEQERRRVAKLEQQKRMREAWRRKQDEVMAQRKLEDELRREQERIDAELEMARIREEEERIKAMEEWEREELMEKMRREEELLRQRLQQEKLREEEERRVREEQRRKQAEALALLRQKQLQRHLFMASLFKEHHYLALNRRFTRAFTFSYFQLLPWLYLNSLKSPDPILKELKSNIQPTIVEEADEEGA